MIVNAVIDNGIAATFHRLYYYIFYGFIRFFFFSTQMFTANIRVLDVITLYYYIQVRRLQLLSCGIGLAVLYLSAAAVTIDFRIAETSATFHNT